MSAGKSPSIEELEGVASRAKKLLEEVSKLAEARQEEAREKGITGLAIEVATELGEAPEARKWFYKDEHFHIVYDGYGGYVLVYWGRGGEKPLVYSHDLTVGDPGKGWVKVYKPGMWEEELRRLAEEARRRRYLREAREACAKAGELAARYGIDIEELKERYGLAGVC